MMLGLYVFVKTAQSILYSASVDSEQVCAGST